MPIGFCDLARAIIVLVIVLVMGETPPMPIGFCDYIDKL